MSFMYIFVYIPIMLIKTIKNVWILSIGDGAWDWTEERALLSFIGCISAGRQTHASFA